MEVRGLSSVVRYLGRISFSFGLCAVFKLSGMATAMATEPAGSQKETAKTTAKVRLITSLSAAVLLRA